MNLIRIATTALIAGGMAAADLGLTAGSAEARPAAPVVWDAKIWQTYWYLYHGQGNVAQNIFEGDTPPPPGLITRENCAQILGPFCPR
ncbi:hypothetical protein QN239_19940 [Mycolicibacterium sp. Y3]